LIIVLRKGHAFEMNEANKVGWEVRVLLTNLIKVMRGRVVEEALTRVNSGFKGLNMTYHQRHVEWRKYYILSDEWVCSERWGLMIVPS